MDYPSFRFLFFSQVIFTVSKHKVEKRVHSNTSLLPSQLNHLLLLVVGLYICTLTIPLTALCVYMAHAGEHSSLQEHGDGVDPSADYHLPHANQQTFYTSKDFHNTLFSMLA